MTIHVSFFKKSKKWAAIAYGPEGLVIERILDDDKAEACALLASKLLSRLHKLDSILDGRQGSFPLEDPIDEYQTE